MEKIYQSKFFVSYSYGGSFSKWCLKIDLGTCLIDFQFCDFLSLKRKLDQVNITELFNAKGSSIEVLSVCKNEHILVLDTLELIDLRDLIYQTLHIINGNSSELILNEYQ